MADQSIKNLNSSLYEGVVRHRRLTSTEHHFRFPLFLFSIDLDEIEKVFSIPRIISTQRFSLIRFCRADYLGDSYKSLSQAVHDKIREETGIELKGPIRLLTNPRYLGLVFNPISLYYCYSDDGQKLEAVVAEVTNTPWGERHCYVIPWNTAKEVKHFECDKEMHVSPFMPMNLRYHWRLTRPDNKLAIQLEDHDQSGKIFDATLSMKKKELSIKNLALMLCKYPMMTVQVLIAIYWQALRLWWKKVPFHSHPRHLSKHNQLADIQPNPITPNPITQDEFQYKI